MAVLVTGASGFLGGRLAEMLVARGEEVVLLARGSSDLRHLDGLKLRVVRGDLGDREALAAAVADARVVFHCAACSTDWAPWETYFSANVTGTENLLRAARGARRLERLVHVSTADIYGYPEVVCGEEAPFVDAGLPYNRTKGLGEQAVWRAFREEGLPVTVVRPATIFGPRGKDFTLEIAKMLRQRMMATIDGGRAPGGFTYVDNVAEAMMLASVASHALGQAYNLSDGTGVTWLEYLGMMARGLKVRMPWIDLSFGAAMGVARVCEAPHRWLGLSGRPLLTRHAVYLLGRDQEFPIAKAARELGFRPGVSIEDGVERSVAWVRGLGKY